MLVDAQPKLCKLQKVLRYVRENQSSHYTTYDTHYRRMQRHDTRLVSLFSLERKPPCSLNALECTHLLPDYSIPCSVHKLLFTYNTTSSSYSIQLLPQPTVKYNSHYIISATITDTTTTPGTSISHDYTHYRLFRIHDNCNKSGCLSDIAIRDKLNIFDFVSTVMCYITGVTYSGVTSLRYPLFLYSLLEQSYCMLELMDLAIINLERHHTHDEDYQEKEDLLITYDLEDKARDRQSMEFEFQYFLLEHAVLCLNDLIIRSGVAPILAYKEKGVRVRPDDPSNDVSK